MPRTLFAITVVVLLAGSCDKDVCAEPADADLAVLPERLSDTGLFDDRVIEYQPAFALWSDGATKRRFIFVPDGAQIDTSDMDDWRFPAGTKLWKEFRRDGVHVETRLLQKTGSGDDAWVAASYISQGDDGLLSPDGATDVGGTRHDVPPASKCQACHGGRASFVLGFSAVQLANVDGAEDALTLDDVIERGLLSDPPAGAAALRLPGDAVERAALGYLHANCASCHNQDRPNRDGPRCYDPRREFDLLLRAAELGDVDDTATHRTVLNDDRLVVRGQPDQGSLLLRMKQRATNTFVNEQMPPLATEEVDAEGVAIVRAWIDAL